MRRAGGVLCCLCLLLLPDMSGADGAVSTSEEAGAAASTLWSFSSTEPAASSASTSATTTINVEKESLSIPMPVLTGTEGMMGEHSISKTSETAPSSSVSKSSTLSANPDIVSSTAWLSTLPMDSTEQHLSAGDRVDRTSEGGATTVTPKSSTPSSGPLSMATMLQLPMTSDEKGVTANAENTESSAATSAGNGVLTAEIQPSAAAGTISVSASAGTWAPTGHSVTSLTTSEDTNASNQTSSLTTASHSMNAEDQTVATNIATSIASLSATGGSLSTSSKITAGINSTSNTQSSSTLTVSPGSHIDSTEPTTASPTQGSSSTATPTVENYCKNVTCPLFSTCVSRWSGYICQCPLGFYFQPPVACVTGKTFPGSLHLHNLSYSLDMENQESLAFKTIAADIERALSEILKNQSGYIRSIVEKLTNGSVMATVSNYFHQSSTVTSDDVTRAIQSFITECQDCGPLQRGDDYNGTSLCGPDSCDSTTTTCQSSNGDFSCTCKDGYFKRFPLDRSCMACSSGYGLQEMTCVACPFGYGGFNCTDSSLLALVIVSCVLGSLLLILLFVLCVTCCRSKAASNAPSYEQDPYLRWPKQEVPKIPRVTMSWNSSQIEMQENGSRNNLVESPVGNGNAVDANRMDGLRTFTCKNPTRYSYLCQGQDNPYFVSDDHAQANLK